MHKRWTLTGTGKLDVLKLVDGGLPELGRQDVLVKLRAVSLNYRDIAMVLVRSAGHEDCELQNLGAARQD
jgi:NADPH:quinone reductase-like Zn-dependent oxidoreductase